MEPVFTDFFFWLTSGGAVDPVMTVNFVVLVYLLWCIGPGWNANYVAGSLLSGALDQAVTANFVVEWCCSPGVGCKLCC